MITRRQFVAASPWLAISPLALSGCSRLPAADSYAAVCADTWRLGARSGLDGVALGHELVCCATLAPSSHNTQCWKFALGGNGRTIAILPDLARRCPAVDPDDHHLFVSLGCAAENLIQAALAHGLKGDARFDPATDAVRVALEPTRTRFSFLFMAIPHR